MTRGAGQVAAGKPVAVYIQGEYGIGKSSIAGFAQRLAERTYGLHGIYATLGGAQTLDDVGAAVLKGTLDSGVFNPTRAEKIAEWLGKAVGEQTIFGVKVHAEALKREAPTVASGMLPFLTEALRRLSDTGARGIVLTLDEINGISTNPQFAHFVKALVDSNALSAKPLPLMLVLCGVEERRREMIRNHQPVERIFDVVDIEPMTTDEMSEFFARAFGSVGIQVEPDAMQTMTHYSAGFPKIMHLIGDAAFWVDEDSRITASEAMSAVLSAAEEVGKKYVDQQVYRALRSRDYHSILRKIAQTGQGMSFRRADIARDLDDAQRGKLDNFLQRMRKLNVLRPGDAQGEYVFNMRMVRLYIWLESLRRTDQDEHGGRHSR